MGVVLRAPQLHYAKDFVPRYLTSMDHILEFYNKAKRLLVITGAGISTDSGIPDYRSPGRPPSNPVLYRQFLDNLDVRKRYWGRGLFGYNSFKITKPNEGHELVTKMEKQGKCTGIITQNVDGYHQLSGSNNVLELHGNLHFIKCISCDYRYPRDDFQEKLKMDNLSFYDKYSNSLLTAKADGDMDLIIDDYNEFILPRCTKCNSIDIHPDIVFMGGNINVEVDNLATKWIKESDSLLVIGSTLTVYSAYKLVKLAKTIGNPIAIINEGYTRADPIADIKIEKRITETLRVLVNSDSK